MHFKFSTGASERPLLTARDGPLSRNLAGSRSQARKSPGLGPGRGLKAGGQSGPGQKSAGQSRY